MSEDRPVALIVGAASRLGMPLIQKYADKGYKIIATSRAPIQADTLSEIEWHQLDITDFPACQNRITTLVVENKGIDTLVICSGYYPHETSFEKQALDELSLDIDVTYKGPVIVSKAFVDASQRYGKGDIVFISSCGGSLNSGGSERIVHCANKAAINRFAETLNESIRPLGLRAFNIIPWQLSADNDEQLLVKQGAISYYAIADIVYDVTQYKGNAQLCTVEVKPSFLPDVASGFDK
jgi:NAD(P)-dependent dehydrogenase (short-subunit alcohol dehydrogenase family)